MISQAVSVETRAHPHKAFFVNGGSARGYQGIFVALAARQSRLWPDRTVGRAVCLYITALGMHVLICRVECALRKHGTRSLRRIWPS
jgi:hypothetical protein